MKYLLLLILILGILPIVTVAQNSAKKPGCPVFSVDGPSAAADYEKPLIFRLNIDRKLDSNEKPVWTTSAGKILSGQGTESIAVENISKTGETITATVEITGLPDNCEKSASASAPTVCFEPLLPMKVDEFEKISNKILKEKIGDFSAILKKDSSAIASVFKYFAKRTKKLDAYRDLQLILNHLKSDGIDEKRIIFQMGFEGDEKTEFWIVPTGAALPPSELSETKPEILDAAKLRRKIIVLSKKQ